MYTMFDMPQSHDPSHFLRREVCRMRAQEPEPEVAVQFINRGHGLNQPSKARPIPVDVLSQEEQFRKAAPDRSLGSIQDFAGVDNDLRASRPGNDAVCAVALTSTNEFDVCRGEQRARNRAVHFAERYESTYKGKHLLHARGAFHDVQTTACNANRSFSVERGCATHEHDMAGSNQFRSFAEEAEGLLLCLLADCARIDDDK